MMTPALINTMLLIQLSLAIIGLLLLLWLVSAQAAFAFGVGALLALFWLLMLKGSLPKALPNNAAQLTGKALMGSVVRVLVVSTLLLVLFYDDSVSFAIAIGGFLSYNVSLLLAVVFKGFAKP